MLFFAAILIAAIFWWTKRRQAGKEGELRKMAAERGWQFMPIREPLAWGFQMKDPGWSLEVLSRSAAVESGPGSSEIAESTCWQARATGPAFLIGPRLSPAGADQWISDQIAQQVMVRNLGEAASSLHETTLGSHALREQYSLWASDPSDVKALLNPAVESALLHWQGKKPIIKGAQGMLQIEVPGVRYEQPEQIDALVRLGEALLTRREPKKSVER